MKLLKKRPALLFVLGFVVALCLAVTASYNTTVRIVSSAGTVLDGAVASATTASYNATVQIVDSTGHVVDSLVPTSASPLAPAAGGVGAMTGAPMWARWFGNGSDGAGPASGAWGAGNYEKQFTSWTCTGAITVSAMTSVIVRSQGAVALNTGCSITTNGSSAVTWSDLGGAGGSGGSGAANSAATIATSGSTSNLAGGSVNASRALSALAAASSGGAGNNGGAISADLWDHAFTIGYPFRPFGGGMGSAGGSTGGAPGNGGGDIIIIAPSITIASGVVLDASGAPGVAPAANSTGAGGGGGGGVIWLLSETFTDNGGIYKYGGGPGGAITQPSIQAVGGGCDTTGCGTGAVLTVTGLTTGGLDATKITITNGGSGYKVAPTCLVNAGGSGLTGSPACHFTISGGAIASVVIDTAGSGGTLTTYTTTYIGGYGANGNYTQVLMQ